MSHDITTPDPHADWYETDEPAQQGESVNPLLVVHRCLRGRYLLAILLAGVIAVPCALLGYKAVPPKYTSVGRVHVSPTQDNLIFKDEQNEPLSLYGSFVQSQADELASFRIMNAAVEDSDLLDTGWPRAPRGIMELDRSLQVIASTRGQDIYVTVTHENPVWAQAAVDAVLDAYDEIAVSKAQERHKERVEELQNLRQEAMIARNDAEARIRSIALSEGTDDLEARRDAKQQHWARLEALIDEYTIELVRYGDLGLDAPSREEEQTTEASQPSPEQLAPFDPELASLLREREQLRSELRTLQSRYTDEHRAVVSAKNDLGAVDAMIDARTSLVAQSADLNTAAVSGPMLTARQIREQINQLKVLRDQTKNDATDLGQQQLLIDGFRRDAARAGQRMAEYQDRLKALEVEERAGSIGRIEIRQRGNRPYQPSTDRRIPLAAIGALGGGGVGVALVAALGFFYPKYRYIDDIEEATRNVFVFGAIPELDPTDPESRQLVAASVHQVRSVIDARLLGSAKRAPVHVVTSAGPAEGKSTVSLRLAKSFAATGRQTLLIDADMIGRRLSSEFGLLDKPGFADNVTARDDPGSTVYESPIRDLSVMPCGRTDRVDPEEISAVRAGALLAPLQEVFDAIVIDTGPVLGSLEAQAIAPVADEVMLIVTRGREVRNVRMAIDRLHRLGARKIGVVFNRATRADIERSTSISATSQRSNEARGHWHDSMNGSSDDAVARLESADS